MTQESWQDYSLLFPSLFRKGLIKIIWNNEQKSREVTRTPTRAQAPTRDFGSVFLIILNYSDYASKND